MKTESVKKFGMIPYGNAKDSLPAVYDFGDLPVMRPGDKARIVDDAKFCSVTYPKGKIVGFLGYAVKEWPDNSSANVENKFMLLRVAIFRFSPKHTASLSRKDVEIIP